MAIKKSTEGREDKWHNDRLRNMDIKYFKLSEFDCPTDSGSGENMCLSFLSKLDGARELAGVSFKITSGYRTPKHNTSIGGVKNSSHTNIPCNACDISTPDSSTRHKIISSLLKVGINRIGIGKNFIHCDTDKKKSPNIIWHYY